MAPPITFNISEDHMTSVSIDTGYEKRLGGVIGQGLGGGNDIMSQ